MSDNQNLLAEQRRALILDEVRRRGGVRVNELTRKLSVSDMTVRRDLDALARQGVVEKVHGGAVPVVEASTHEPGFEAKSALELSAKEDIARAAAQMVAPGTRDRAVGRHDDVRAGAPAAGGAGSDGGHQLGAGRRCLPRGAAGRRGGRTSVPARRRWS